MKKYSHGGDVYNIGERKIDLDFSINLNPLGLPKEIKKAIIESVDDLDVYPDPFCRELTKEIGVYENIDEKYILCGNGAADLIYKLSISQKFEKGLLIAPTFSEYEESLKLVNCNIKNFFLNEDKGFSVDYSVLEFIEENKDYQVLFLCNPNNPVGNLIEENLLKEILKKTEKNNMLLVVDECFLPFVNDGEKFSLKSQIGEYKNLIVLRAFTKTYAMAGIRIGYMICGNEEIIDEVFKAGQPWSVSVIGQKAGVIACKSKEHIYRAIKIFEEEKPKLIDALQKKGFKVYDSMANFVLFKVYNDKFFIGNEEINLKEIMMKKGILIRDCSNYSGLSNGFYRISVKNREETEHFIKVLEEI